MASKTEARAILAAGVVQGIALITFPAASTIFTDPSEIKGIGLSGLPAFLTYLGVHLYYLGGIRGRRLEVLNAWVHAGTSSRQNRVIEGELPPA